jgi:hypothetical protein
MARNPRPPKPIESFGPELFQALLDGSKREVKFQLPYRKAVHFRQRINQLRAAMRDLKHEHYPLASQAKITISWPDNTETSKSSRNVRFPKDMNTICDVVIMPSDSEFNDVLKSAGVNIKPLDPPTTPSTPIVEEDILASYVKES